MTDRANLKRTATQVGGVLLLDSAWGDRVTILIENHAVVADMPHGWQASYFGPNDVKAAEIRLQTAKRRD